MGIMRPFPIKPRGGSVGESSQQWYDIYEIPISCTMYLLYNIDVELVTFSIYML